MNGRITTPLLGRAVGHLFSKIRRVLRAATLGLSLAASVAGSAYAQTSTAEITKGRTELLSDTRRWNLERYEYLGEDQVVYMPSDDGQSWLIVTLPSMITTKDLQQLVDHGLVRLVQPIEPADFALDERILLRRPPEGQRLCP